MMNLGRIVVNLKTKVRMKIVLYRTVVNYVPTPKIKIPSSPLSHPSHSFSGSLLLTNALSLSLPLHSSMHLYEPAPCRHCASTSDRTATTKSPASQRPPCRNDHRANDALMPHEHYVASPTMRRLQSCRFSFQTTAFGSNTSRW